MSKCVDLLLNESHGMLQWVTTHAWVSHVTSDLTHASHTQVIWDTPRSDVRHDSFTWDMTHSHDKWLIRMINDSLRRAAWLIPTSDTTHSQVCIDSFKRDMTHSHETWLIHMRHDSFLQVTRLTQKCAKTHSCHSQEWVMAHVWVSHVAPLRESCLFRSVLQMQRQCTCSFATVFQRRKPHLPPPPPLSSLSNIPLSFQMFLSPLPFNYPTIKPTHNFFAFSQNCEPQTPLPTPHSPSFFRSPTVASNVWRWGVVQHIVSARGPVMGRGQRRASVSRRSRQLISKVGLLSE